MKQLHVLTLLAALACPAWADAPKTLDPPPNAPATVEWNAQAKRLSLRYHGVDILDATVSADAGNAGAEADVKLDATEPTGEKFEQRLKFTLAKPQDGVKLVLRGTAIGSDEAFPAETAGAAQKRFPMVRNSVGLSRNLRNNALYDRRWDWLLAGPDDGGTRIQPKAAGGTDLKHGFARVRCPKCREEFLVPYSCRGRCFCPSCHQKRALEKAGSGAACRSLGAGRWPSMSAPTRPPQ